MRRMAGPLIAFVAVTVILSFFRLGHVRLFDVDEAVFSTATKEMVESGDWITPTYNGENRYDKPILFYWLMALSYKVFGVNEFGARFPSALAAFLLALSTFLFVRHFCGDTRARHAALSSVLALYFVVYSHAAVTDMVLTLFITLSLFSFYLSVNAGGPPERKKIYLYGFYLFSSLAFLTKGLIGIVFPFGIATLFMVITEGWSGAGRVFSLKGTALFLAVSAPWYGAQLAVNGREFIEQFFIKHHFRRYTGVISGHRGPAYYYIPALVAGTFPWIAFLPAGIRNLVREKERLQLFALIWFVCIVAFFSASVTKLPNYVLPALPGLSLLIGSGMAVQDRKWLRYSNAGMAVLSLLVSAAFFVSRNYLLKFGVHDTGWTLALAALAAAIGLSSLFAAIAGKARYVLVSCLMLAFLSILSVKALPLVNQYLQGELYEYSVYAKDKLQSGERIITYGINNPSIVFYSGHRVVKVQDRGDLAAFVENRRPVIAITKGRDAGIFQDMGFDLLKKGERYAILERK